MPKSGRNSLRWLVFSTHALWLLFGAGTGERAWAEESHPGIAAESLFSEAVLAFNRKQGQEALRILSELLKASPNHIEALELKALTLKTQGDDPKSLEAYEKLVELKPDAERGPYHFEIGVILQRQKKPEAARAHFENAVRLNTNAIAARLYLGLIGFNSGDLDFARTQFDHVKAEANAELRVVARYYLGLIHFKSGYAAGGTSEMFAARALAADIPESKMAQDVRTAADKIMAPYSVDTWFATLSLLSQYDSNVSQIPSEVPGSSSTASSGKATPKLTLNGAVGRVSSPLSQFQWMGSYRMSYNKNLKAETKGYEFFSNTGSLSLNYRPLSSTTGGLKVDGTFTFQNLPDPDSSQAYLMGKYNVGGEIGPFIKTQIDARTTGQIELSLRPQKFYTDPLLDGSSYFARATVRRDSASRWLAPGASMIYERNRARGDDNKYTAFGLGAYNQMKVTAKDSVTVSGDFLFSRYALASIPRNDRNLSLRAAVVRVVNRTWSLLGDVGYAKTVSDVPESYSYNRMTVSVGASWSL